MDTLLKNDDLLPSRRDFWLSALAAIFLTGDKANAALSQDWIDKRASLVSWSNGMDPKEYEEKFIEESRLQLEAEKAVAKSIELIWREEFTYFFEFCVVIYNKFLVDGWFMNLPEKRKQCLFIWWWQRWLNKIDGVNLKVDGILWPHTLKATYMRFYALMPDSLWESQRATLNELEETGKLVILKR